MGWKISRLSSSLMGLLREPESVAGTQIQLERIRQEILACVVVECHKHAHQEGKKGEWGEWEIIDTN